MPLLVGLVGGAPLLNHEKSVEKTARPFTYDHIEIDDLSGLYGEPIAGAQDSVAGTGFELLVHLGTSARTHRSFLPLEMSNLFRWILVFLIPLFWEEE